MKHTRLILTTPILISTLVMAGCASQTSSGNVYREGETMQAQTVQMPFARLDEGPRVPQVTVS